MKKLSYIVFGLALSACGQQVCFMGQGDCAALFSSGTTPSSTTTARNVPTLTALNAPSTNIYINGSAYDFRLNPAPIPPVGALPNYQVYYRIGSGDWVLGTLGGAILQYPYQLLPSPSDPTKATVIAKTPSMTLKVIDISLGMNVNTNCEGRCETTFTVN